MSAQVETQPPPDLIRQLTDAVGADNVRPGDAAPELTTDVYRSRMTPLAVVSPGSADEVQSVVRICSATGTALFTRGGGASYTDGYLPTRPDSVLIDMRRLDRILEINERDAYVTVEAGVTWLALKAALDPLGLRTPFFGPFSGMAATVGGSMSQHSISHGSGTHGVSAQSMVCMDVVIASGAMLRTGSSARGAPPHFRWVGPDLGGLFCGDCGALGIKVRITLPLLRRKAAFECLSFAHPTFAALAEALRLAALERLDDEHFAIDAAISQGQIARQERSSPAAIIQGVWRAAPSPAAALRQLVSIARAGTAALSAALYTTHFIVEGADAREARSKATRLRALMAQHGTEISNTVAAVVRGMPFAPLYNTLGPRGERWVPVHGLLPHSRVADFHAAVTAFFAQRDPDMRRLGVWWGGMFMAAGSTAFLYELALYWPGAPSAYHRAAVPADYLAQLPSLADSPQATAYVEAMKRDLVALYSRFGALNFQLGKAYPYASVLEPDALSLVRSIKASLDPHGLMNPGALEL